MMSAKVKHNNYTHSATNDELMIKQTVIKTNTYNSSLQNYLQFYFLKA